MKYMKLMVVLTVSIAGLAVCSHAADIYWAGGTGQWTNTALWLGGSVPDVSGSDSAIITNGTSIYDGFAAGDVNLTVNTGNRIELDGGTLEQVTTHWMIVDGGSLLITNSGSLSTAANVLQMKNGTVCRVDGALSSIQCSGNNRVTMEIQCSISLTGGAVADFSGLAVTLWDDSQFNLSGTSVGHLKNLVIEGWEETPSFVSLSDQARLNLSGSNKDVISVDSSGSCLSFESGYTGYVNIRGIDQTTLETMISEGKFGIDYVAVTTPSSFKYTSNGDVVNIGLVLPPVPDLPGIWQGGTGDWFDATKWSGGVVPDNSGADDVVISSPSNIVVTYVPGPDLVFNWGSDLLLDGAALYQDSTAWSAFYNGSALSITNGGAWLFASTHMLIYGHGTGETVHTVDGGAFNVQDLEVEDHQVLKVTNGAVATLSNWTQLRNGSRIDITDATLHLGEINLTEIDQFFASGDDSLVNVNDGAWITLDAGFYGEGFKTNVIQNTGNSIINFVHTDTSGEVFIDSISRPDVDLLIGQGKFGIGGAVDTAVNHYTILAEGAGQKIRVVPMPIGSVDIESSGSNVILSWDTFDGQSYAIQDKESLGTIWGVHSSVVGAGGYMSVTVAVENAESFYRITSE